MLAPLVQHKPVPELQAISGYLSRQPTVRHRSRLFAWLASRDFGTQLLHGRSCQTRTEARVTGQAAVFHHGPALHLCIHHVLERRWSPAQSALQPPPTRRSGTPS